MSAVVVCSGKGSPGATFVAANLAAALSRVKEEEPLLLDLDPAGGDLCCYLGLDRYPGRNVSPHMRTVTLKRLMDMGYGDRLCPAHDCICLHIHKENPDGSIPDEHEFQRSNPEQYLYIKRFVIPDLMEMGATEKDIEVLFVDNPRRFLTGG